MNRASHNLRDLESFLNEVESKLEYLEDKVDELGNNLKELKDDTERSLTNYRNNVSSAIPDLSTKEE